MGAVALERGIGVRDRLSRKLLHAANVRLGRVADVPGPATTPRRREVIVRARDERVGRPRPRRDPRVDALEQGWLVALERAERFGESRFVLHVARDIRLELAEHRVERVEVAATR